MSIPRVITRDRAFKHKKSQHWNNIFENHPKLYGDINNDMYVNMKVSSNYVDDIQLNDFVRVENAGIQHSDFVRGEKENTRSSTDDIPEIQQALQVAKNNKVMSLELTTTLSRIDAIVGSCMDTVHRNIMEISNTSANVMNTVSNIEISEKDFAHINNFTCIQLETKKNIFLDTGQIKLWPNQQDLAFYLLDKEYQHHKLKFCIEKCKTEAENGKELEDRIFNYIRIIFNVCKSKWYSNPPHLWDKLMEITRYSHGKSYPLLTIVKNSTLMNNVVIITSCGLVSYQWTRYCQKMKMTYKVLKDPSLKENGYLSPSLILSDQSMILSDSFSPESPIDIYPEVILQEPDEHENEDCYDNIQVVIIDSSYYKSGNLNRDMFEKFGRCIVDVHPVDVKTHNEYDWQISSLTNYLIRDDFEFIYNLSNKNLTVPESSIFGCNYMNTVINEAVIMPPVRIYDDNTIKIENKFYYIRWDHICSIVGLNLNEYMSEEDIRDEIELPSFLTLYSSKEKYLLNRLKLDERHQLYIEKKQKLNDYNCNICHIDFDPDTKAFINYACCVSSCCLSCFWNYFHLKKMDAFRCPYCRATEKSAYNDGTIDHYMKNVNESFDRDTRVLVLGAFSTNGPSWKSAFEYTDKWFGNGQVFTYDSVPIHDSHMTFEILKKKNFDNPNGTWAIFLDTAQYIDDSFYLNPHHFENVNTIVFLSSVSLSVKELYIDSFSCSTTELKIYHFNIEEPSAYV